MQSLNRLFFALVVVFCWGKSVALKAQDITLYAMHFPPHVFDSNVIPRFLNFEQHHAIYGLDADLVREAYASQGVNVHYKILSWVRIVRGIRTGSVLGALTCRYTSTRDFFSIFSQSVSFSIDTLVTRKHALAGKSIDWEVLKKGSQNIAVGGWSQISRLKRANVPYSTVSDLQQGFNLILHRGSDALIVERNNAIFIAHRLGIKDQLSFYDLEGGDRDYYSVCFSRKYPDSQKWRDVLNKGLMAIQKNGTQEKIFRRYGVSSRSIK